ncbi:MAG: hypothetical protein NW241_01695, partial [Bacteroidia bacterium]|nr:hypothetical protein [Bacteroidia bacterium]
YGPTQRTHCGSSGTSDPACGCCAGQSCATCKPPYPSGNQSNPKSNHSILPAIDVALVCLNAKVNNTANSCSN